MNYCTRQDMENAYGCSNIARWADIENDKDADHIESRINWAIGLATSMMDDVLINSPYEFPIAEGTTLPVTLSHQAAVKAATLLYDSRGIRDADPEKDPLGPARKAYNKWIAKMLSGQIRYTTLNRHDDTHTFPEVVS